MPRLVRNACRAKTITTMTPGRGKLGTASSKTSKPPNERPAYANTSVARTDTSSTLPASTRLPSRRATLVSDSAAGIVDPIDPTSPESIPRATERLPRSLYVHSPSAQPGRYTPVVWSGMHGFLRTTLYVAGVAAMLRGLAAFDAGASAASNYPLPSAILFIGGAFLLLRLRDADRAKAMPQS